MRFLPVILLLLFASCDKISFSRKEKHAEPPLARVYDKYLYFSDIKEFLTGKTAEDSAAIADRIIEQWVKDGILMKSAEEQLTNLDEIEKKVKSYRQSLILAEFRNALLEKYSVNIEDNEIEEYYINHIENFLITEPYIMIKYILLPPETENISKLEKLLNQDSIPHFIMNFCRTFPDRCYLEDEHWLSQTSLTEDLLLPPYHHYESNKFKVYETEDENILIFKIVEKRNKGEIIPLKLVRNRILQILTYKKRRDKLQEIEDKAYINKLNTNAFEIYK
jgi:hypothetical protein